MKQHTLVDQEELTLHISLLCVYFHFHTNLVENAEHIPEIKIIVGPIVKLQKIYNYLF